MRISKTVKLTLWANRAIAAVLLVLIMTLPRLLDWYLKLRPLDSNGKWAILIGFYCCAPMVALALWNLDRLLRGILKNQVFVPSNVRLIRNIRWCCLGVGLICLPASCFYPPLIFIVVIMAFLALVISVLCAVMDAAVSIREENDLTI